MFTAIMGKVVDSLGVLAVLAMFVAMMSPAFAQEMQIISSPNVQIEYESMNNVVIQEEGVSTGEGTYIATIGQTNIMPTATITGTAVRHDTIDLSTAKIVEAKMVPLISDKEVVEIEASAKAYLKQRKDRLAKADHHLPTLKEIEKQTKKEIAVLASEY